MTRGLLDALLHGWDILLGNGPTEDLVNELELRAAGQRFEAYPTISELTVSAGLFFVTAVGFRGTGNRLPVGDPRRMELHFDAELLF